MMDLAEKLVTGKCLTEGEVQGIVTLDHDIDGLSVVTEVEGDTDRWSQFIQTIIAYKGHYYSLQWQRGLTEMQENYYDAQRAIEVERTEKTITVIEWRDVNKK